MRSGIRGVETRSAIRHPGARLATGIAGIAAESSVRVHAMGFTAWRGGQIRHTEIGAVTATPATAPTTTAQR